MAPPSRKPDVLVLLPAIDAIDWQNWIPGRLGTIHGLVKATGMQEAAIRRHLRTLRCEGQARIGGWIRTLGCPTPVWVLGSGEDAPLPKTRTTAQYCRKYRRRVRRAVERARKGLQYDDRYNNHVALALADDTAQRSRISPQHWFSLLGGL